MPTSATALAVVEQLASYHVVPPSIEAPAVNPLPVALLGPSSAARAWASPSDIRVEYGGRLSDAITWPTRATAAVRLGADGLHEAMAVRLVGATAVAGEFAKGYIVYPGALPSVDVVHRPSRDGFEDYYLFQQRPATPRLELEVTLSPRIAGMRSSNGALELVDADGTPLYHVSPPFIVDRGGVTIPASLAVVGCDVDGSDQPSWGRPPTPPGSEVCRIAIAWDDTGVEYPAVLDPTWTAGGAMPFALTNAVTAVIEHNGKQLAVAVGGLTANRSLPPATPIYDPDTNTWSSGPALGSQNQLPTSAVAFRSKTSGAVDSLFVAGGYTGSTRTLTSTTQILAYNSAGKLTWSRGPSSRVPHLNAATALVDNRILLAGGIASAKSPTVTALCEMFDPASRTFVRPAPPDLPQPVAGAAAVTLADGHTVVVAGGTPQDTAANPKAPIARAELFTGSQWIQLPDMPVAALTTGSLLPDGRVLFAGGIENPLVNRPNARFSTTAQLFTYSTTPPYGSWTQTAAIDTSGRRGVATPLPNGTVLLAPTDVVSSPAGQQVDSPTSDTFLFDPRSNAWAPASKTSLPHGSGGVTTLRKSSGQAETIVFGGLSSFDGSNGMTTTATDVFDSQDTRVINLDARALTQTGLIITSITDIFDSKTVQPLALIPGSYSLQIYSAFISDVVFTVKPDGTVDYDRALDGVLSGRETGTLVVNGRTIRIETNLSQTSMALLVFGDPEFPTQPGADVVLLPAHGYSFLLGSSTLSNFSFDVDVAGHVHIPPEYTSFAGGEGSSFLYLYGFPITLTAAPGLSSPISLINVLGAGVPISNLRTTTLHLLPVNPGGGYLLELDETGELFWFNVDLGGHVIIDPPNTSHLAGAGTSAVYVRHHGSK